MADDSFLDFLLTESDELIASSSPDNEMPVAMAPMAPVPSPPSSFPPEDTGTTSTSYPPEAKVPAHMLLGKSLEALSSQLAHAPLEQLVLTTVGQQEKAAAPSGIRKSLRPASPPASPLIRALPPTTIADIVRQYNCPTVCLVMRRPGCPFCREDALELSRFVQQEEQQQRQQHQKMNLFSSSSSQGGQPPEEQPERVPPPPLHLIGIVKDATSDALGLYELATRYFPHDLYRDVGLATYEGLGNRTVTKSDLLRLPAGLRRTARQNIAWNMTGWTDAVQGGVLIFDATGMLRYAHHEIYADQLVMDDIRAAVRAVQQGQQQIEQQHQQQRP
jgi:hypothetical protein